MKERRTIRWAAVLAAAVLIIMLLLSGCSTKRVAEWREVHDTIHTYHTDTTYITRHVADTVRMKDSVKVVLKESGDTMRVEVWRDRWHESIKRDTVLKVKTDTVYKVQVAEKEKVSKSTPFGLHIAWRLLILLAFAAAVWWFIRRKV